MTPFCRRTRRRRLRITRRDMQCAVGSWRMQILCSRCPSSPGAKDWAMRNICPRNSSSTVKSSSWIPCVWLWVSGLVGLNKRFRETKLQGKDNLLNISSGLFHFFKIPGTSWARNYEEKFMLFVDQGWHPEKTMSEIGPKNSPGIFRIKRSTDGTLPNLLNRIGILKILRAGFAR